MKTKPQGYWTKERCKEVALKYKYKTDFKKGDGSAYAKTYSKKWQDYVCSHMEIVGDRKHRCIYVYEFSDNHAYIGLTYNIENRKNRHTKKGTIYNYIHKTNLEPKIIQLTEYLDIETAKEKEEYYVNHYRENGWNILNIAKTGSLGGNILIWTKDKCFEIAKICKNKKQFREKYVGAYNAVRRNNWLEEINFFLKDTESLWDTKLKCHEQALKYDTRSEFSNSHKGAYDSARRNDWLDDICSHMKEVIKPSGYWSKNKCLEESLKFNNRQDFKNNINSAYQASYSNGWLDDICSHMKTKQKSPGYWNDYDKCLKASKTCKSTSEFNKKFSSAYLYSLKNKWIFFKSGS